MLFNDIFVNFLKFGNTEKSKKFEKMHKCMQILWHFIFYFFWRLFGLLVRHHTEKAEEEKVAFKFQPWNFWVMNCWNFWVMNWQVKALPVGAGSTDWFVIKTDAALEIFQVAVPQFKILPAKMLWHFVQDTRWLAGQIDENYS